MTLQDDLLEVFKSYDKYNFDPVDCLSRCETLLGDACAPGAACDPREIKQAEQACNAYGFASAQFLRNGLPSAATSILVHAWDSFSDIQSTEAHRIYRAGLAMYLAKSYLTLGDKGSSLRWALLTHADDLLGRHPAGGGAGRQLLLSALGMTASALDALAQIAQRNLVVVDHQGWSAPSAFPEDVIAKFAFQYPEYSQLFATPSTEFDFPLNSAYLGALATAANIDGITSTEKGRRLEDLATYLFLLLPGLVPRRNVLEDTLAFETDIVIRNLTPSTSVVSDLLGRHFLVECKNWANPVGVQELGYFLYRIGLTHATFGVIFAANGITGDEQAATAAQSLIRKSFHEDGTVCIVIDGADVELLRRRERTVWSLIVERLERVRFGRAR